MAITQTVTIPANRRLVIDVPREVPAGPVILTFTPASKAPACPEMSLLSLRGSCKGFDTMDAYFARKRADKALENRKDNRMPGKS